jgi:very-short-patch-repair endonuclease
MRSPDPKATLHARELRRNATSAESKLWSHLRNRQFDGCKFVRQEPVGPFIVDFLCRQQKLVVEIDGATHSTEDEVAREASRTRHLEVRGYRVIRFHNEDVYQSMDVVIEEIRKALK